MTPLQITTRGDVNTSTAKRALRRRMRYASSLAHRAAYIRCGFTLNEVLIALGILAIGSVAVASLFPTAAFLQKQAVKETLRQNHIRSADAVLEGVGLDNRTLLEFIELMEDPPAGYPAAAVRTDIEDPGYDVFALAEVDLSVWSSYDSSDVLTANGIASTPQDELGSNSSRLGVGTPDMRMGNGLPNPLTDFRDSYVYEDRLPGAGTSYRFPLSLRSLPSIQPGVDYTGGTGAVSYRDREVFWVPLVRAGLEASEAIPDWSVYLFVLQPDSQLRTSNPGAYEEANYGDFDRASIVCANPDAEDYVPKVFRVPVDWKETEPNLAEVAAGGLNLFGYVKPGELVLGNNGKIYRVAQIDPASGDMILASQTLYEPINERDLTAIWVAPAPGGIGQSSPLADIRLMSNGVVRTNDF